MTCVDCGKPVETVAAALATKFIGPDVTEFRCLCCFAAAFKTSEARLLDAARRYRDRGCVLFQGLDLPGETPP